jgi:hypothetical protein
MIRWLFRTSGCLALAALLALATSGSARAVPSFALQTGQPCTSCHIGGFGPQLTPFGRAFKIGGYTQGGGEGWTAQVPLAVMAIGSFTHTGASQPEAPARYFQRNDNFAFDQVSLFLAGRLNDYVGAFIQGTYNGVDRSVSLDNTDLRVTAPLTVRNNELRVGLSVNNGPTVQDPYNSTFAWIFPFATSQLAPTPTAQPLLAGGLIGNSVGVTAYGWYDRHLYLEGGVYNTYGSTLTRLTGAALGPGATATSSPYLRAAYEWNWAGQSAHVGALFLSSHLNPALGSRSFTAAFGTNRYTDFAVDAGYQFLGDGTHVATVEAIYTHENQALTGSFNMGASSQPRNALEQARVNLTYFYQNTYGINFGWQNTWGKANPALYAPAPVTGSANGKPQSNSFVIEADWVPFGKEGSWASPWANLKIGLQYTICTRFNGGNHNYDGFGRNASGNNTLFLYAWLAF